MKNMTNYILIITSIEVVLLERRDACIMMKKRRLSAKATFKTASKCICVRSRGILHKKS
ncbi:hypothetical protein HanRHA438_Chr04g0191301 [Helianthus annuus]|nr:hypothetical protein HanIR_Chr04g0195341 [Helianthus annuus]KAJ0928195.1 hypothetical protein HanRHA438_Chr04g0191301 [Helianthus annuus]